MKEERRGSQSRKAVKTIHVDEETYLLLKHESQSVGLSISVIVGYNTRIAHDLRKNEGVKIYDPDWKTKLKMFTERVEVEVNNFEFLKWCDNLGWDEKDYICLHSRIGRSPEIKKLGKGELEARTRCGLCIKDRDRLDREANLEVKVQSLENKIEAQALIKFKAPVCNVGAILSAHGTQFSGCRRHPGEPVSVDGFCRVYRAGLPCMSFAEVVIGVGSK